MSIVEKFEVSNLDILGVILDVLIVNKVEGMNDTQITDRILCFKYIIHLYLDNINEFEKKFKTTYNNINLKYSAKNTILIKEEKIFEKCPTGTYKPFEKLNTENPFKGFNIDNFFKENFKNTDNDLKMKKRGLVYFIKFTPYILLLNHIMDTAIDEKNIEILKKNIKTYAPDIKTINTFSSFTQKPKSGLVAHINANADEYIKLNKLIFD